jgi:hypothetical protein
METNTTLTIYNKYYDATTKADKYQRFVLAAAIWEDRKDSNVLASGGDKTANQAIIYIPFAIGNPYYLKPKVWLALTTKTSNFTLQINDLVVKGTVTDTLSSIFTPSDLLAKYDDVLRITSVDTYDVGSLFLRHWKIGAK